MKIHIQSLRFVHLWEALTLVAQLEMQFSTSKQADEYKRIQVKMQHLKSRYLFKCLKERLL